MKGTHVVWKINEEKDEVVRRGYFANWNEVQAHYNFPSSSYYTETVSALCEEIHISLSDDENGKLLFVNSSSKKSKHFELNQDKHFVLLQKASNNPLKICSENAAWFNLIEVDGTDVTYCLLDSKLKIIDSSSKKPNLQIVGYRIIDEDKDDVFEPNSDLILSHVTIRNPTDMTIPYAELSFFGQRDRIGEFKANSETEVEVMLKHRLSSAVGEVGEKPTRTHMHIKDEPKLFLAERPLLLSGMSYNLLVQFPVYVTEFRHPQSMVYPHESRFEVWFENVSLRNYGGNDEDGLCLNFSSHNDCLSFESSCIPVTSNAHRGAVKYINVKLHERSLKCVSSEIPFQLELWFRGKVVQRFVRKMKIGAPYLRNENITDAMLVTSSMMTETEVRAWQNLFEMLNLSHTFWDFDRHHGMHSRDGSPWLEGVSSIIFPHFFSCSQERPPFQIHEFAQYLGTKMSDDSGVTNWGHMKKSMLLMHASIENIEPLLFEYCSVEKSKTGDDFSQSGLFPSKNKLAIAKEANKIAIEHRTREGYFFQPVVCEDVHQTIFKAEYGRVDFFKSILTKDSNLFMMRSDENAPITLLDFQRDFAEGKEPDVFSAESYHIVLALLCSISIEKRLELLKNLDMENLPRFSGCGCAKTCKDHIGSVITLVDVICFSFIDALEFDRSFPFHVLNFIATDASVLNHDHFTNVVLGSLQYYCDNINIPVLSGDKREYRTHLKNLYQSLIYFLGRSTGRGVDSAVAYVHGLPCAKNRVGLTQDYRVLNSLWKSVPVRFYDDTTGKIMKTHQELETKGEEGASFEKERMGDAESEQNFRNQREMEEKKGYAAVPHDAEIVAPQESGWSLAHDEPFSHHGDRRMHQSEEQPRRTGISEMRDNPSDEVMKDMPKDDVRAYHRGQSPNEFRGESKQDNPYESVFAEQQQEGVDGRRTGQEGAHVKPQGHMEQEEVSKPQSETGFQGSQSMNQDIQGSQRVNKDIQGSQGDNQDIQGTQEIPPGRIILKNAELVEHLKQSGELEGQQGR